MENRRAVFGIKSLASLFTCLIFAMLSGCGGSNDGAVAAPPVSEQPPVAPPAVPSPVVPQLTLLAGNTGGRGSVDGAGSAARFYRPNGVAVGKDGSLYIADTGSNLIRRMTAGTVTTLAGTAGASGYADGAKTTAKFNGPRAIAVDSLQNVFVADTDNRVVRKINANGDVTTFAGTPGVQGNADGQGSAAQFSQPVGLTNDGAGNLYVVDKQLGDIQPTATLRKITPAGNVTTVVTNDSTFAVLSDGITADNAGNLYVIGVVGSDTVDLPVQTLPIGPPPWVITIRTPKLLRISPAGDVTTLGVVQADGTYGGVAIDQSGDIYFSNSAYHTVYIYSASTRQIGVFAGSYGAVSYDSHGLPSYPNSLGSDDGMGTAAHFHTPVGLATDADGNLYIADQWNHEIRKASPAGLVTTVAGAVVKQGASDGLALEATFGPLMNGSALDGAGNVYVSDNAAHIIRKITPEGQVTTLAGSASLRGSADGTGAAARFSSPTGIAADVAGNVYVADTGNALIRKIGPGGEVTTIAGTAGNHGYADGIGSSALFQSPTGITRDSAGNLFVTDAGTIRKITPAGVVSTIAGAAGTDGANVDGIGAAARFNRPFAITVDAGGNLYVADIWSYTIRKISPAGQVVTIAGNESGGYADGSGSAARFTYPTGIVVDSAGNLYVTDSGNSAVRKIAPDGMVSTVIVAPPTYEVFPENSLQSLAFDGANTLYLTRPGGVFKLNLGGR
jgi:sugar lactone lactonase YvrE